MKCVSCGSEITIGLNACPRCDASRLQLPPRFSEIEQRYISLRQAYQDGRLALPAFQAELSKVAVKDERGFYWTVNSSGQWCWYSDKGWVAGDPPVEGGARPASSARRKWGCAAAGCLTPLLVLIGILAIVLVLGYDDYLGSPMLIEGLKPGGQTAPVYALTDAQQDVVTRLGNPEAFTILFYQEEGQGGGAEDVRYETWLYYREGSEVSFLDGELVGEGPLNVETSEIVPMPYRPEMFTGYMNLDEVIGAAGLERYLVIPTEEAMMEDAQVFFAQQLAFGLKGDELIFVESLALESE